MSEGDTTRFIAWGTELRAVHGRLRDALRVTQVAARSGEPIEPPTRDLLLFCHGFCTALTGHHDGEDRELFPAIVAARPDLGPTLHILTQDHAAIAHLVAALQTAAVQGSPPEQLERHLDGIAAIMESHFRYEERELLAVLDTLAVDADPAEVLGPLHDRGAGQGPRSRRQ